MLLNIYILTKFASSTFRNIMCIILWILQVPYKTDAKGPSSDIIPVKYLFYPNIQNA